MIRNTIADKITPAGKAKNKGKEEDNGTNKTQEIYIPPEKRKQIIDDLRWNLMDIDDFTNLSGDTTKAVPKFITKKCVEVHDQSGNANDRYKSSKQIRFKTPLLQSDLCDYSDAYIVVKGTV